jgi:2-oxoglutarate ferredoxin oxidoreductase subunit alpha
MSRRLPKLGGVYLQAESEIASINMVLGASAAGVRVMTSSSSPGISLMSEGISYIAGCDLPCVIVNIQRGGPGLGGIQPSQADYFQATRASGHGDFHLIVLAPNSVQEMADLTKMAFDLADKYRMPAMILGDGILGQMMEPVILDEAGTEPLTYDKPWATTGPRGARPPNIINSLILRPEGLEQSNFKRFERYAIIKRKEQLHEEYMTDDADIIIAAYGAVSRVSKNAIKMVRARGIKAGLIRPITLWPFPTGAFAKFADRVKGFISVEMSMGQLIDDVKLSTAQKRSVALCARTGGMVHTPEEIAQKIMAADKGEWQ